MSSQRCHRYNWRQRFLTIWGNNDKKKLHSAFLAPWYEWWAPWELAPKYTVHVPWWEVFLSPAGEEAKPLEIPERSLPLDCLWGGGCELWKPGIFYTSKLCGRVHHLVPAPFEGPRGSSSSAWPPVVHVKHKMGQPGEFGITHSLRTWMAQARWRHSQISFFKTIQTPSLSQQPNYVTKGRSHSRDRKGLHTRRY